MMKYFFTIILVFLFQFKAIAERNPLEVFFTNFLKNSHLGISIGGYQTLCNHGFKTKQVQVYLVGKRAYLYKLVNIDNNPQLPDNGPPAIPPPNDNPDYELFLLQWPSDVFMKFEPEAALETKIKNKIAKRNTKKYKLFNTEMKATGWTFPIRFIFSYEFGCKLRLNIEPSIDLVYINKYELFTSPPDDSKQKPKSLGTFIPEKQLSYYVTFPISLSYNFWRSKFFNLLLSTRAGIKIPSFFSKGKLVDLETFWDVGLKIESNTRRNFKPFLRLSFASMDAPDKRLNKVESAVVFSTMSFGAELGITFRLLTDKPMYPHIKSGITRDHIDDYTKYRGRSYFGQRPRKSERYHRK